MERKDNLKRLDKLYKNIVSDLMKEIKGNNIDLVLLAKKLDMPLGEVIDYLLLDKRDYLIYKNINKEIKIMNNNDKILCYKEYLDSKLKQKMTENLLSNNNLYNGSEQVINILKQLIKEEENEKNIFS